MKRNANNDADSPRIPYSFCDHCNAPRAAIDPGEVYPVCEICKSVLVVRYEEPAPAKVREQDLPREERPAETKPFLQPRRRDLKLREEMLEVLHQLVADLDAASRNPATYRALLTWFNPFLRGIVNDMLIGQIDWRTAVKELKPDFCLRYQKQLEEFKRWAESQCDGSADLSVVPAFIEPEQPTHHEPLSHQKPTPTVPDKPVGL